MMSDAARIVLVVLGVSLRLAISRPLLLMGGVMGGGMSWAVGALAVSVLVASVALVPIRPRLR